MLFFDMYLFGAFFPMATGSLLALGLWVALGLWGVGSC